MTMPPPQRLPFIDALKAIASQLIVLHHIAFYGPMSDAAASLAPTLVGWLSQNARIAVQVFLVVAGFLAARQLAPAGTPQVVNPFGLLFRRYWRLAIPYLAALAVAIAASALARSWMTDDVVPDVPTLPQILAHAALLHSILGYDSLSAGVWYVAIDFQLFAATVLLFWLAQRLGPTPRIAAGFAVVALAALALASLLHFNLDADWDVWAVYFFGAYALGALAYWSGASDRSPLWLVALLVAGLMVASVNDRPHTIVALSTALALGCARRTEALQRLPASAAIAFLGRISYSVFLVHFPVFLVVNAAFCTYFDTDLAAVSIVGMLTAWLTSLAVGALFYRFVERPLTGTMGRRTRRLAQPA
jgi:peptidoglycan/LPS O-acetylase OafA/YrhL